MSNISNKLLSKINNNDNCFYLKKLNTLYICTALKTKNVHSNKIIIEILDVDLKLYKKIFIALSQNQIKESTVEQYYIFDSEPEMSQKKQILYKKYDYFKVLHVSFIKLYQIEKVCHHNHFRLKIHYYPTLFKHSEKYSNEI